MGSDASQPGNCLGFWKRNLGKRFLFIKDKSSEIVGLIRLFPHKWESGDAWGKRQLGMAGAEGR